MLVMNTKAIRLQLGYSQQGFADATGIPKDRLSKWELGKGNPKAEDTMRINKLLMEKGQGTINAIKEENKQIDDASKVNNTYNKDSSTNYEIMLAKLIDSNQKLSEAVLISAHAQKDAANNMFKVANLMENNKANSTDNGDATAIMDGLLRLVLEVSNGKKLKDYDDAILALNTNVVNALPIVDKVLD